MFRSPRSVGFFFPAAYLPALLLLGGCDASPEFVPQPDIQASGGGPATGGQSTDDDNGDTGGGFNLGTGGETPDNTGGSDPVAPCEETTCNEDQHCEVVDDEGVCEPNNCQDLDCSSSEECIETSNGAYCEDLSCEESVDCDPSRFCSDDGICVDDTCEPGARSCSEEGESAQDSDAVFVCRGSGGGYRKETDCGTSTAFVSVCVEAGAGKAGCGCEDDWNCPGFQTCEAGLCQGSLDEPSCRLAPADLSEVLPTQELIWGGAPGGSDEGRLRLVDGQEVPLLGQETGAPGEPLPASLSPWSDQPQATQVPLVANLDDDNGDGLIDERDVAEIIFMTFGTGDENRDGVLRAIHGGGTDAAGNSKKGRDYFAVCGPNRFFEGEYFDASGASLPVPPTCDAATNGGAIADLDPGSTLAVGDLDFNGTPEIVAFTEASDVDGFTVKAGRIVVFDNTGQEKFRSALIDFEPDVVASTDAANNPAISLANVVESADPADEMVEIIVGRDLFVLSRGESGSFELSAHLAGTSLHGVNQTQGPVSCVADLIADRAGMEIVAGNAVYGVPLVDGVFDPSSSELVLLGAGDNAGGNDGFCAIADVWGANTSAAPGPANPLDEKPEIVLVRNGATYIYDLSFSEPAASDEDWLVTLLPLTGLDLILPGNTGGGAPNIDDFDGDGFPEIGTAGPAGYIVFDLQESVDTDSCPAWTSFLDDQLTNPRVVPSGNCSEDADCNAEAEPETWAFACNQTADVGQGACVCLHNSWRRLTQDASSQVTGSSVFDFNGDGSAEVIYNDECHFRMYAGLDGSEAFLEPSEGRTRIEYPIVADVDNDGNAEIVFGTSTESGFCNGQDLLCTTDADCPSGDAENGQRCLSAPTMMNPDRTTCQVPDESVFNAGIEVWGDLSDRWVSARRIWNQYSYHVTQVTESGAVPRVEPNSWEPLGERLYNTYRSQPRSLGSAPDLVVDTLQVIAPGSCGDATGLVIGAQVSNAGDLRVSNVPITFLGTWEDDGVTEPLTDADGTPLQYVITQTLEPGGLVVFQVEYAQENNDRGTFPDEVTIVIDPEEGGEGVARECNEDNNSETAPVDAAPALPDLRLLLEDPDASCPPPILGTVFNDSEIDAENVVVRLYSGDPSGGADTIGDLFVGDVPAGGSVQFDTTDEDFQFDGAVPVRAPIRLYGDVDPDDDIEECNEANNRAGPTAFTQCNEVL